MKFHPRVVLASLLFVLTALVSVSASATSKSSGNRAHSQTYHNRTPTVHSHGAHPHRG